MRAGETVATQGGSLYDPNLFLGRSPQPVYDEGSTRSAVRHAYGLPFPISAPRHSQPESRDPASHPGTVPCTGTATNKIEFFPQPHKQHARHRQSAQHARAGARTVFPQGTTPSSSSVHALHHKQISQSAVRQDTAIRRTGRRTVRDGTCSIQYGVQCATAHSSIQRTTRSVRIRK